MLLVLQGEDETARLDVLDTFDGMSFLPIDSLLYLKVQMALNQLLTHQPNVVHTALFFEGQLVYSSLSRGGTQQLHRLVTKMMGGPATKKPEVRGFVGGCSHMVLRFSQRVVCILVRGCACAFVRVRSYATLGEF